MRDHNGETVTARDVLDDDEMRDYQQSRRDRTTRGFRAPHPVYFPAVDEDGLDSEGCSWGASPHGRPR